MTKYEIIFEALQEKVDCGELTVEQAEEINSLAYDKYVIESGLLSRLSQKFKKKQKNSKNNDVLRTSSNITFCGVKVDYWINDMYEDEDTILESLKHDISLLNKEKNKIFKSAIEACEEYDKEYGDEEIKYSMNDIKVLSCGGYDTKYKSRSLGLELVVYHNNEKKYDVCFEFIKFENSTIDIGTPSIEVL